MTGEKDPRDVMQAEHDARLSEHSAFQAPAEMPGVEEIARVLFEFATCTDIAKGPAAVDANAGSFAGAILALFAPILAEKQKPTVALNHWKSRALAAEAALAAERERAAALVEFITDPEQDAGSFDAAHCQNIAQAAFNDHSPHATMNTRLKSYGAAIAAAIRAQE